MKKTLILVLALLLTLPVLAQDIGGFFGPTRSIRNGAASPATCSPTGDNIFYNTTSGLVMCTAANTWGMLFGGGTVTGSILLPDGTAGAPSIAFSSDADGTGTGIFRSGANSIGFVTNGVERWIINASGVLQPLLDNTYDIGATVQPRDISLDRTLTIGVSTQGASTKTLTESAETAFVQVDVASGAAVGGYVEYAIYGADAADHQLRSGILPFAAVNKAGTETCTIGTVDAATEVVAVSIGTLTNTFTCTTTPANGVLLNANAVSSLTQTTLQIRYRIAIVGAATVTTQ